jgi:CHAD domain-containing protein
MENNKHPTSERTRYLLKLASSLWDQAGPHLPCQPGDEKVLQAAIQIRATGHPKRFSRGFSRKERKRLAVLLQHWDGNRKHLMEHLPHSDEGSRLLLLGCYRLILAFDQTQNGTTDIDLIQANSQGLHIKIKGPQAYCDLISAQAEAQCLSLALQRPIFLSCDQRVDPEQFADLPLDSKAIGVTRHDPIPEAAKKVLRFHFARMLHYEPGTRTGEDSEALHKMRVATRRMRAAFGIFKPYFDGEATQPYRQALRETARALGEVRDLDVFQIKLESDLDGLPTEKQINLDPVLPLWHREREQARTALLRFLDGNEYQTFVQEFNLFLNRPEMGVAESETLLPPPYKLEHVIPSVLYDRLGQVQAYEGVLERASLDQQHKLRIKVKRLRYAIEFMGDMLGEEQKEVVSVLEKMQDHLGDLNDTKETDAILRAWLEQLRDQNAPNANLGTNTETIETYLAVKREEQDRLRAEFPQVWRQFDCPSFKENLARAIFEL